MDQTAAAKSHSAAENRLKPFLFVQQEYER